MNITIIFLFLIKMDVFLKSKVHLWNMFDFSLKRCSSKNNELHLYSADKKISHSLQKHTLYISYTFENMNEIWTLNLTTYLYLKPLDIYWSQSHEAHSLHPCSSNLLSTGSQEIIHMKLIHTWCPISSSFTSLQSVITYNLAHLSYYVLYYASKNKESFSSG